MENEKISIWNFLINRTPITILLTIAIVGAGIFSAITLPRELQPEITIPFGSVSTFLPGANPTDVESLITEPLEKEIASIANIKTLSSSSSFGASIISIEFEAKINLENAINDLKEAVDRAKSSLPEDATDPMVIKAEANESAIISFSLISDYPLYQLTKIAEDVEKELKKISGISKVDVIGGQAKRIEVILDKEKMEEYGLSIEGISNIINFSNTSFPLGSVEIDKLNYSLRVDNKFKSIDEIRNTPIITLADNSIIILKDFAKVYETYPEQTKITNFSINGEKSKKAISLRIYKKNDANIIEIADNAKEKIEELKGNIIPKEVEISVSNDNSYFIKTDLGILIENGIQTTVLIFILLFLALGFKEGLVSGLSIPLSFLITFIIMSFFGMTINSLSLFSLVIALGLMVDTSIVIMEGIHENIKKGETPKNAALLSVTTFKWPLIAGTMTTIFAFFPMLLVSGIMGEFLRTLPITISAALFASLIVSLIINPSLSTLFLKNKNSKNEKNSILEPIFRFLSKIFESFIRNLIKKRSRRIMTILISIVLFMASLSLPATGILKSELFPKTDVPYFIIDIETPTGTVIEETEKITKKIEEKLYKIKEAENFLTIIGSGQAQATTDLIEIGGGTSSNQANITVNLVEEDKRDRRSYEISEELRQEFKKFTEAKISIRELSEGPPTESPITIKISGPSLEKLTEIANEIENIVKTTPNTQNVRNSFSSGLIEFKYKLDPNKVSQHGLSVMQVASSVRNIIQGLKASKIKIDGEDIDIILKYNSTENIQSFPIQSPKGYTVSLAQLGNYELTESLSSIPHEKQDRIVKIISDITSNGNVVEITNSINAKIDKLEIPGEYTIKFGGDLEEIAKSFQELYVSMLVGIMMIAFTLVLMFNSFKQPLIILFTLPLALIGVFPGLMAVGLNLSFPAFLGVVALAGVVVNDAIVLIDQININIKENMSFNQSIIEATNSRLQPIIMTSLTTIVGILPLALTNEFWAGLGFALVFGLICSTLLTLIVIPVLYHIVESKKFKKTHGSVY